MVTCWHISSRASRRRAVRGSGEGLFHQEPVTPLHPLHLARLRGDGHAPVDEAEPTLERHDLGHGAAGDAVHVG